MSTVINQGIKISDLPSIPNLESGDLLLVAEKSGQNYATKKIDASYINNLRTVAANLGSSGAQIYEGAVGGQTNPLTLRFRRITNGADISVSQTSDSIIISAPNALKVASNAEVWSGMVANKAVSPAGLASKMSSDNAGEYIVKRDYYGNFAANIVTASLNGNASSATQLQTLRNITLSGDLTGAARTNFSGDVNIVTSLNTAKFGNALAGKQPINGSYGSVGLTGTHPNQGIYFNNLPSGVKIFTIVVELWIHSFTGSPGQGIVQIGTTAQGLLTKTTNPYRMYWGAVNNVEGQHGFSITGWANTGLSHMGVFNFYVATSPFNPTTQKRLIYNSQISQINEGNGATVMLNGAGYIDYTGEINQIVLRNAIDLPTQRSASAALARLYWSF